MNNENMKCPVCKNNSTNMIFEKYPGYLIAQSFDVFKCDICDTNFVGINDIDLNDLYEKIYKQSNVAGYDRYLSYAEAVKHEKDPLRYLGLMESTYFHVHKFLDKKKNKKVLEIGCGYGYLTYSLRKKGFDALGIDINKSAIEYAERNFGPFFENVSLESYSGTDSKFDLIIATELIEHLQDPNFLFEFAVKLLKPGGQLFITTPNKNYYPPDSVWQTDMPPVHVTWLGNKSLEYLAGRFNLNAEFLSFRDYFPKNENKIVKFVRSRKETLQIPILKEDGTLNKDRVDTDFSKPYLLFKWLIHHFAPIRFVSNLSYNFFSGKDITLAVLLTKKER